MYKLFHWLFGWDYIYWRNSPAQGIARVHCNIDGTVWYWRYKNINCLDLINTPNQVIWLTCTPTKYFKC